METLILTIQGLLTSKCCPTNRGLLGMVKALITKKKNSFS